MRLSRQFQACLFFLQNDFPCTKSTKRQNKQLSSFLMQKIVAILVQCLLIFVLLFHFCLWHAFLHGNLFVNKMNRLEIVLITSFYYTTDMHPYQPTYWASIYTHLFLFVAICENLFESYLRSFVWIYFSKSLWK